MSRNQFQKYLSLFVPPNIKARRNTATKFPASPCFNQVSHCLPCSTSVPSFLVVLILLTSELETCTKWVNLVSKTLSKVIFTAELKYRARGAPPSFCHLHSIGPLFSRVLLDLWLQCVIYLSVLCDFSTIVLLAVAELGLVGHQLHRYGNSYENYANNQYKHGLGILLFSVVASLLVTLSHPWLSVWSTYLTPLFPRLDTDQSIWESAVISICSFIMAVFFGTGAGIIQQDAPFTGHGCKRKPLEDYPVAWRPYVVECDNIIAIQGVAWSLCQSLNLPPYLLLTEILFPQGSCIYSFGSVPSSRNSAFPFAQLLKTFTVPKYKKL